MTYAALFSRLGYKLFDAMVCVEAIVLLVFRDIGKHLRRSSESRLVEVAMQFDHLDRVEGDPNA